MSAQHIYNTASLGSLIAFSNGAPCPPARFKHKCAAWRQENGVGRLVQRTPERIMGNHGYGATFMLHLGDFDIRGTIVMVTNSTFSLESELDFRIVEVPLPGMVRVLTSAGGRDELRFLASDMAAAEDWMARNHFSGQRAEIVTDPDPVVLPVPMRGAA